MRRSSSLLASGLSSTPRTTLKMAALAPMPSASVATLALGIGANAAIFSVVRGVLLRPLANRDEERLIYIRQTAKGIGAEDAAFSVPEIRDFKSGASTISEFGDFSVISFTVVGLGEP